MSVGDCGCSVLMTATFMGVRLVVTAVVVAGGTTGLKPDGVAPNTGTVAVDAKEMTGAGKARLNRGSVVSAEKLAGGERWSGEARGGVRGAYGWWEVTGILIAGGGAWETLVTDIWALAATAALMASSRWAR